MHPISERITNILSNNDQKAAGATLLSGPWGCGKTYLWTWQIKPALKTKNIRPIYISLFGVATADELRERAVSAWLGDKAENYAKDGEIIEKVKKFKKVLTPIWDAATGKVKDITGIDFLSMKLDWFQFIPDDMVFCFDDLERASLDADIVLGFINYLVEQRKAKILLIANEDFLRLKKDGEDSVYDRYKEKVIWTSIRVDPDMHNVYDIFLLSHSDEIVQQKLKQIKEVVLGTFKLAKWDNLRTLQKTMRYFAEVLLVKNLDLAIENVVFLTALIIDDAKSGLYGPEVYRVARFSYSKTTKELRERRTAGQATEEESASLNFYENYWEDKGYPIDYNLSLYNFVKNGVLNGAALREEIHPTTSEKSEDKVLLYEGRSHWLFQSEQDVKSYAERCLEFLKSGKQTNAIGIVHLYYHAYFRLENLGIPFDLEFKDLAKERLRKLSHDDDESLDSPFFSYGNEKEQNVLKDLVDGYHKERAERIYENSVGKVRKLVERDPMKFDIGYALQTDKDILRACLEPTVLETVKNSFGTKPGMAFSFLQEIIEVLKSRRQSTQDIDVDEAFGKIRDTLKAIQDTVNLDKIGKIRLSQLETLLPKEDIAIT